MEHCRIPGCERHVSDPNPTDRTLGRSSTRPLTVGIILRDPMELPARRILSKAAEDASTADSSPKLIEAAQIRRSRSTRVAVGRLRRQDLGAALARRSSTAWAPLGRPGSCRGKGVFACAAWPSAEYARHFRPSAAARPGGGEAAEGGEGAAALREPRRPRPHRGVDGHLQALDLPRRRRRQAVGGGLAVEARRRPGSRASARCSAFERSRACGGERGLGPAGLEQSAARGPAAARPPQKKEDSERGAWRAGCSWREPQRDRLLDSRDPRRAGSSAVARSMRVRRGAVAPLAGSTQTGGPPSGHWGPPPAALEPSVRAARESGARSEVEIGCRGKRILRRSAHCPSLRFVAG